MAKLQDIATKLKDGYPIEYFATQVHQSEKNIYEVSVCIADVPSETTGMIYSKDFWRYIIKSKQAIGLNVRFQRGEDYIGTVDSPCGVVKNIWMQNNGIVKISFQILQTENGALLDAMLIKNASLRFAPSVYGQFISGTNNIIDKDEYELTHFDVILKKGMWFW